VDIGAGALGREHEGIAAEAAECQRAVARCSEYIGRGVKIRFHLSRGQVRDIDRVAGGEAVDGKAAAGRIAIAMIEWLESDPDVTAARACLDPELRHLVGKHAYENVVLTKLREARLQGPEVEEGFTMILSDMLAVCAQGATPDSSYYADLADRGIIERSAGAALEID
jgi:hypothetical protein